MSVTDIPVCPILLRPFSQFPDSSGAVLDAMVRWLGQAEVDDLPLLATARLRSAELCEWTHDDPSAGKPAVLDAAEITRRVERRIGELIRVGQAEGRVRSRGQWRGASAGKWSPGDFLSRKSLSGARRDGVYAFSDIPAQLFEQAVGTARADGNLSRSHLCQTVHRLKGGPASQRVDEIRALAATGHNSAQIAKRLGVTEEWLRRLALQNDIALPDIAMGPRRRIDSNRVVGEMVPALEGLAMSAGLVDLDALDVEQRTQWALSMQRSLRQISSLARRMRND